MSENSKFPRNVGLKISGTGRFTPDVVVKNDDFATIAGLETDDEWVTTRTGIKERRFNSGSTNYDMMAKAAKDALASANISANDIDMIIATTASPDFFYPSMSCLMQNIIKAENAFAIDVHAACTGFVNALDIARNYLSMGSVKRALIVSGEMLSNQMDFNDRTSCILFGDGAGAVIVEAAPDKLYFSHLGARGETYAEPALHCKALYRCNNPFADGHKWNAPTEFVHGPHIIMNGKEVYKFATDIMPKAVKAVCEKAGVTLDDIDLLIPHQANIRIINTAMKSLDVPMEKVYVNIENTGNISSACIPVCLDELYKSGRLTSGMKVCLVAFGAGLTYGSIIFEV